MGNVAEAYDEQSIIQEALDNFSALLDGCDFTGEMALLGIGRFQFLRRKQMLVELRGLYIALWRLALARSFPGNATSMFDAFLSRYVATHPGKIGVRSAERAREYWGMLEPSGDSDFHVVARHLTSFVITDQVDNKPITLKIALHIRNAYSFIFDRLI